MAYPARVVLCLAVCVAALVALPAAAMAGSISGTVTAENGGAPIAQVEVCPQRQPYTVETDCTVTNGAGNYSLSGLPEGSYMLHFSASLANLKYVNEFYDNKRYPWESDLVPIAWNQDLTGLNVQLAEGGSISGVLSEEGTGVPIGGVRVCASDHEGIPERCASSGPSGEYRINGLRSDTYRVEFEGGNRVNYLREFYKDAASGAEAEGLEVEAPNLLSGIHATLAPGAQIFGHVSDIADGGPVSDVMVCAEAQVGEFQDCDWTDAAGDYALRSLPAGTYLIAFELEYLPFGTVAEQWWQGVSLKAEATPIEISPPETRDEIDGQVRGPYRESLPERPPVVTYEPKSEVKKSPPPRCRKGFHRKRVAGKSRCVRKHPETRSHKNRGR
jgi:carboxypeptidase family protein